MNIKEPVDKWPIKLICFVLVLGLAYGVICYFLKSPGINELDAIAINPNNNEIAISFYEDGFAKVLVFDNLMNKKYGFRFDDAGGRIHEMSYDENGNLYVYLGREEYHIRICPDGTLKKHVDIGNLRYEKFEDTWNKAGSAYKKTVNGIEYVYDYAGFFDYYGFPVNVLYAKDLTGTNIIWSSKKD